MHTQRIAYTFLLFSASFSFGAAWCIREAEGYISKHYGIENPVAHAHFSHLGSLFFWLAVAFWGVGLAATFWLAPGQRKRVQYYAALLPLIGILVFVGLIFFFPVSYV